MKKLFLSLKTGKIIAVLALSLIMVATTAVSFTYWKSGISGASKDKGLNVTIGSGSSAVTTIEFGSSVESGGSLIPKTRTPDTVKGETTMLTFEIPVKWTPTQDIASTPYAGVLYVNVVSLILNGKDFASETTTGGNLLFDITCPQPQEIKPMLTGTGVADNTVIVTITVELNEPRDSSQYYEIVGRPGILTLEFEVKSNTEEGI